MLLTALLLAVRLLHCSAQEMETVYVEMRDGTKLHTILNFPLGVKRINLPAIMERSPYGQDGIELIADLFVPLGYVGVRQDMRGTGKSEGYFNWYQQEEQDSTDTNNWILAQNWSDGKTVMQTGASADGLASFCSAQTSPPELLAQYIIWSTGIGYPTVYPNGAYKEYLTNHWACSTVKSNCTFLTNEMEANEQPSSWWNVLNMSYSTFDVVHWPTLMWAGWYDIFLAPQLTTFEGYQSNAQASVAGKMKIVIDPCGHCQDAAKWFPENMVAGRSLLPITLAYDLFNGTGQPPVRDDIDLVTFYVMGANAHEYKNAPGNYWTSLPSFPVPSNLELYLGQDSEGNKLLSSTPPSAALQWTYTHDPANPVPTLCGSNLFLPCGPCDQTSTEEPARADVLTFTSAILTEPLAVTGELKAVLYVTSDQVDTDFMVKITDLYPAGSLGSILLQDSAFRMRWREYSVPKNMTPGTTYEIELSLWNTSYVFDQGHAIRIDISSSNYPRFSVNPNNGWPLNTTDPGPLYQASNTVFSGNNTPSRVILPQVELSQMPEIKLEAVEKYATRILGAARVKEVLSKPSILDGYGKRPFLGFGNKPKELK